MAVGSTSQAVLRLLRVSWIASGTCLGGQRRTRTVGGVTAWPQSGVDSQEESDMCLDRKAQYHDSWGFNNVPKYITLNHLYIILIVPCLFMKSNYWGNNQIERNIKLRQWVSLWVQGIIADTKKYSWLPPCSSGKFMDLRLNPSILYSSVHTVLGKRVPLTFVQSRQ